MAEDTITTSDEASVSSAAAAFQPERKTYSVVSESGLYKNGKNYKKGGTVELDEKTATNFLAAGDIEEQA